MYTVLVEEKAQADFERIAFYIRHILLNQNAAINFVEKITNKYEMISKNPYGYAEVPFGKYWYRKATIGKYIIAFRIDEQTHTVHIIAIGHSLQKRQNIIKHK